MAIIESKPQIIVRNGKPKAVILDIRKYERLLQMAEEKDDLSELRRIKRGKTSFRELEKYIRECV